MRRKMLLTLGLAALIATCVPITANAAPKTTITATTAQKQSLALTEADKALLRKMFDADYYAKLYPELVKLYGNNTEALFNHFLTTGIQEGRQMNKDFNVSAYRSAYTDLNNVFGTNIMAYYRHYSTVGKAEGRTITTVAKAQDKGIVVTDFDGEHLAADASGNVVSGVQADKIIISNPVYANAVDNVGGMTLAEIKQEAVAAAAIEEAAAQTTNEDNNAEEDALRARVARYNAAYAVWKNSEPQKSSYLTDEYTTDYAAWQAQKPDKSIYVKSGVYETKAQAEAKYNSDYAAWQAQKPVLTDAKCDTTAYNSAHTNWQNTEPQLTSYGITTISTGDATTVYVLASKVNPSVAVTITVNDGFVKIDDVYYKNVDQDGAYHTNEVINAGYLKTDGGIFYKNTVALESDAYTITKEELNSGYFKDGDSYKKIVDKSEATQEVSGYSTYDLNGTTVYYYSDDRLDLKKNENEIFVSMESQRTDVVSETDGNGNTFWYDPNKPDYEEDGISPEDFEERVKASYPESSYYIYYDDLSECRVYKKLTYNDITVPEVLKDGVIRNEIGEYYKYRNEPKTEIKDDYYLDETNNRYYKDATKTDAVATPYSKVLNSDSYIEIGGIAYEKVTSDEAATYVKELNDGYVEKNGVAYTESDKATAATESVNSGYCAVTEDDVVVYYQEATESNSDLEDYNEDHAEWVDSKPELQDYPTEEYTENYGEWEAAEPDADSDAYSYGKTPYATQEAADAQYATDEQAWEEEEPDQSDYLDQDSYDSAVDEWEAAEPELADF